MATASRDVPVTQWVENPDGGRDRGPRGLVRAWVEVLVRPRRFFENGIAPADQAPGLVFAVAVTFSYVGGRLVFDPGSFPVFGDSVVVSALLVVGVACLLVAPLALHLTAALGTLALIPLVRDRAGISETVQAIAYATAPCVFAAIPIPEIRVVAAAYGAVLLAIGFAVVHDTTPIRAALAALLPATLVFGFAFGGFSALETLFGIELVTDSRTA